VSWQAPGTLGRLLADGAKRVEIFDEEYKVKAEVAQVHGLSAHAGQDFLAEYALSSNGHKREIYLVHGEPDSAKALMARLDGTESIKMSYPELNETVER
jgi:metallo-beta-lactamase family protein